MQAWLVVVDKDAGRDVHCIYQAQAFPDAAFGHQLAHLRGDVDKIHPGSRVEFKIFGQ